MRRILEVSRNCVSIAPVTRASAIIDGAQYYRDFYAAAKQARHHLFILGWQFDSTVHLLRGNDVPEGEDVRFLPFLNSLCESNPDLRVYILAWDYSIVYAREREFCQKLRFEWNGHERLKFEFDSAHSVGASQHQKLVVVDDAIAFAGGMDICENRWDDRNHLDDNPQRCTFEARPYGPYHDVQVALEGPVVGELAELFVERWELVTDERIPLDVPSRSSQSTSSPSRPKRASEHDSLPEELPIHATSVAISRTQGASVVPPLPSIGEIRAIYADAVEAAEQLVYIENQYFTAAAIFRALASRMRAPDRSKLAIVLVLPRQGEAPKEELALGIEQGRLLRALRKIADETGHCLGIYFTGPPEIEEKESTYIHSKLMIVDDRFLTIGTANTTNRSLGLDSELNLAFEATDDRNDAALRADVCRLRVSLLAEHAGITQDEAEDRFGRIETLVEHLDECADEDDTKLHPHPLVSTMVEEHPWLENMNASALLDPDEAMLDETVYEAFAGGAEGFFGRRIEQLRKWLDRGAT